MTSTIKPEWAAIKNIKNNKPLFFVHVPKCGGTYVNNVISKADVNSFKKIGKNTHKTATKEINDTHIVFAVIREPISRYESLINYRISTDRIAKKFKSTIDDYDNISLYVNNQTDKILSSFRPYYTLIHYSRNVDIFITIDELTDFLTFFGHDISKIDGSKLNTSTRKYGKLNKNTIDRLRKIFKEDIKFYQENTS
jgi:hypothetical protein